MTIIIDTRGSDFDYYFLSETLDAMVFHSQDVPHALFSTRLRNFLGAFFFFLFVNPFLIMYLYYSKRDFNTSTRIFRFLFYIIK